MAKNQLDLVWVPAVSVGEEHSFIRDSGWLDPHAGSEGGQGHRDFWEDSSVDATRAHGEEQHHLTT